MDGNIMYKKIISFFSLFLFFIMVIFVLINKSSAEETSSDAIAIRVIPNPENLSATKWYEEQGFSGSPQSITVDGYRAVRDGRTVYVNAANINGTSLYTNIYLISYNQEAEDKTIDVYARVLKQWKFNTNITSPGLCEKDTSIICFHDSECDTDDFCENSKSRIVRDVIRLEGLNDINLALESYYEKIGLYPQLKSGSYLQYKTLSVWPSWQKVLAQALDIKIPVDPVNEMGDCGEDRFHETTCWDDNAVEFADPLPMNGVFDLPSGSRVYKYESKDAGKNYELCAYMESGFVGASGGACAVSSALANNAPNFTNFSIPEISSGEVFNAFIAASDYDGDEIEWTTTPSPLPTWAGWSGPLELIDIGIEGQRKFYASQAGNPGTYSFTVQIHDGNGGIASKTFTITVNTP